MTAHDRGCPCPRCVSRERRDARMARALAEELRERVYAALRRDIARRSAI